MKTATKTKTLTRMQAEKQITQGVDPATFKDHPNYHVRRKAWFKAGRQLLGDGVIHREQDERFLVSLKLDPTKYLPPPPAADLGDVVADVVSDAS